MICFMKERHCLHPVTVDTGHRRLTSHGHFRETSPKDKLSTYGPEGFSVVTLHRSTVPLHHWQLIDIESLTATTASSSLTYYVLRTGREWSSINLPSLTLAIICSKSTALQYVNSEIDFSVCCSFYRPYIYMHSTLSLRILAKHGD